MLSSVRYGLAVLLWCHSVGESGVLVVKDEVQE